MKNHLFRVLLLLMAAAGSQAQILTQAEYFVDTDPGVGMAVAIPVLPDDTVIGDFSVPMSGLPPGYHWLFVRTRDEAGRWSIAMPSKFYVYSPLPGPVIPPRYLPIVRAEYFIDTDPGPGLGVPLPLIRDDTVIIDRYLRISGLDTGYHYLYIRAIDEHHIAGLARGIRFHVDTAQCDPYPLTDFTYDTATFGTPCLLTNRSVYLTGATFRWDVADDPPAVYTTENAEHTFPLPGIYKITLTVTQSPGCSTSFIRDLITGPVPDTNILVAGALTLCSGDSVILTSNNYEEGTTFEWSTGQTTRAITVKTTGDYYCRVMNIYGIYARSETVHVEVRETPQVVLTTFNATGGNANGSAWMDVTGGTGNVIIHWSDDTYGPVHNDLMPGDYSVTVTDGYCPVVQEFTIADGPVDAGAIVRAEYFLDTDPGTGNATPVNIWAGDTVRYRLNIPATGLTTGFHHLYLRFMDTYGRWGIAGRHPFYVYPASTLPPPPIQPDIVRAEYFINTDPGVGNGTDIPISPGDLVTSDFFLPTYGLTTGFYNLYIRTMDRGGKWGIHAMTPFYIYDNTRVDLTKRYKALAGMEYFYDTDPGVHQCLTIRENILDVIDLTRDIRIGSLTPGTHRVYMRPFDERGIAGMWKRAEFTVLDVPCTCPLVDFTADTVHVLGNPTQFTDQSLLLDPGATYDWDVDGDGVIDYNTPNVSHVYAQFGLYNARLTVHNTSQCYASMTRQIVVSPVVDTSLIITGPTTFCDGNSVTITAMPGYTYNWSHDETTQSVTIRHSGDYSVRLTNIYGVQGFSRVVHVTVHPVPEVTVTTIEASDGNANGTAICNVTGGTGNYSYSWSNGTTQSIANNLAPGIYTVLVDDGRCPVTREFTIGNHNTYPGDIVRAEYFFDTDPGVGMAIPLNISGGSPIYFATLIPVNGLSPGYHLLCVRTQDNYQRWSMYRQERFYVYSPLVVVAEDQPRLIRGEYFYDQDPGTGNGTPIDFPPGDHVDVSFNALTDGLPTGFHNLWIRVMDSLGKWSIARGEQIYHYEIPEPVPVKDQPKLIAGEYFFDTDPGVGRGIPLNFTPTGDLIVKDRYLPVSGLMPGIHHVWLRMKDEGGAWSIYRGASFQVIPTACTTPDVHFTTVPVNAGVPVTFPNTSGNLLPTSVYAWDIGNDGTTEYVTKDFTHTFAVPGTYVLKLTVRNSDTCKASILEEFRVGPLPPVTITVEGPTAFCEGGSVKLSASPGYTYEWWPTGETTQSIFASGTGDYYCWLSTPDGLEVRSEVIPVTEYPIPDVTLHTIEASGGNANGSAWVEVTGGSGHYTYAWSSGVATIYANDLAPGSYTVVVNDGHCPVEKSFIIGTHPVVPGNILAAEYFFDTDPGVGLATPMNISAADMAEYFTGCDVTGLDYGYHILYIRVMDTYGRWGLYKEHKFLVYPPVLALPPDNRPPIASGEYFVDLNINTKPDPGVGEGTPVAFPPGDVVAVDFGFSVDTLVVGFHTLAARVRDLGGAWGHIFPAPFYLYDTTRKDLRVEQPPAVAAEYFLDTDPGAGNGLPIYILPGNVITGSHYIPMGTTPPGEHFVYIRVRDPQNQWSLHKKAVFTVYNCTQPTANFDFVQTCITEPVVFNDLSVNVDPAATYDWDFNNDGIVDDHTHGSVSHLYTVPGIYQCKLKITHNVACFDSVIKTVVFPYVDLPPDTTIYTDQSIVLDAGPGYTYLWSTGETTQTITIDGSVTGPGVFAIYVMVTNGLMCTATDAIIITVTLPPRDLIIESASILPASIPANGDSADLSCLVRNTGTISAVASVVNYYLSEDATLSPDDLLLGFGIVNALAAGAAESVTTRHFVPAGIEGQTRYILFKADGGEIVIEDDETNNVYAQPFDYGEVVIPENLHVTDVTVFNGQVKCFNARQVITVAGSGSTFSVLSGGSAIFIAGQRIRFLAGTHAFHGGYLHGYITTTGDYCYPAYPALPAVAAVPVPEKVTQSGLPYAVMDDEKVRLWPNPTGGELFIGIPESYGAVTVNVVNTMGILTGSHPFAKGGTYRLSLADQPPGIYFLFIRHGLKTETVKVIRY